MTVCVSELVPIGRWSNAIPYQLPSVETVCRRHLFIPLSSFPFLILGDRIDALDKPLLSVEKLRGVCKINWYTRIWKQLRTDNSGGPVVDLTKRNTTSPVDTPSRLLRSRSSLRRPSGCSVASTLHRQCGVNVLRLAKSGKPRTWQMCSVASQEERKVTEEVVLSIAVNL
jgi:hypothetical protein